MDIHKKMIQATVLNGLGEKMLEKRFENSKQELSNFTDSLSRKAKIVIEACGLWQSIYDQLEEKGFEVQLAHPLKTRAIAEARIKTDKVDSLILAQLLRTDFIAKSYVPEKPMRELRDFVRHRAMLVRMRTELKNRIHAILMKNGLNHEFSDLFGKQGTEWLKKLQLSNNDRFAMDNFLAVLATINSRVDEIDSKLFDVVAENKQAELLTTMPGLGPYSALLVLAEIGDIKRFPDEKKLCSYAGLVPRVYQSGSTIRRGKMTKQGSKWLRWIMIQAAHKAVLQEGKLQSFYYKIFNKKGKKIAIGAVARKMLVSVYYMLRDNKNYSEVQSHTQAEGNSVFFSGKTE
jgi:transposase